MKASPDSELGPHKPKHTESAEAFVLIPSGSQRTALVERREAAPKLQMNFLQQITTHLGVKLVSPGEAVECRSVGVRSLLV
jgi:hypothetical protein